MKRSFLAVSLLILFALAGAPAGGSAGEGVEALYLAPADLVGTFTTIPPESEEPVEMGPTKTVHPRFIWQMSRTQSVENWTLAAGAPVRAHLFFGNLDQTVPAEVRGEVPQPHRLRIDVDLFIDGGADSDDTTLSDIQPSGTAVASGTVHIDHPALGGDADAEVEVALDVPREVVAEAAQQVDIRITLHGVAPAEERPVIYMLSTVKASRAEVPGYPVAAVRALEEAQRAERECNQLILQGKTCAPEPTETSDVGEAPPASLVLVGASAAGVVAWSRRSKKPF